MNETSFPVTFKLKNARSYPVCIERGFSVGDNINLELEGPMGEVKLKYPLTEKMLIKEYLINEKTHTANVAKYEGRYDGNNFTWNITGNYSLIALYQSVFTDYKDIAEDKLEFEIRE